jgi:hypothetical protein
VNLTGSHSIDDPGPGQPLIELDSRHDPASWVEPDSWYEPDLWYEPSDDYSEFIWIFK